MLLIVAITYACIEKPEFNPDAELAIEDLFIPDGFNFDVTSNHQADWQVNNLPANTFLKAEIYSDGKLQVAGLVSNESQLMQIEVPLHNNDVEMVLYMAGERFSRSFEKTEQLKLEVDYKAQSVGSVANRASNNGVKSNDSDGDGVKDDDDLEPNNPLVSQAIFIPALETFNTIGFEDTWPNNGDYDYNDLVVSFNLNKYMDKSNTLSKVVTDFKLLAVGAGYDNDFCYTLEVPLSKVKITLSNPDLAYELHGNEEYTEVRFTGVKSAFHTSEFVNTVEGDPFYEWLNFTITTEIDPSEKINGNSLPYDFFIRINGEEGREVHLAGKHPTGKVNRTYFGSADDNSQPSDGKLYVNDRNLPWAVMVPDIWEYPSEKVDILKAYPDFAEYAQNNPSFAWYSNLHSNRIVRSKLYKKGK